jgi:hypothetical protein
MTTTHDQDVDEDGPTLVDSVAELGAFLVRIGDVRRLYVAGEIEAALELAAAFDPPA